MQIWAESGKSALPICNYSQILYQFLTFTQNLKRSRLFLFRIICRETNYLFNIWIRPSINVRLCIFKVFNGKRIDLHTKPSCSEPPSFYTRMIQGIPLRYLLLLCHIYFRLANFCTEKIFVIL